MHSHTWYANLAGHLAALLHGIPHVVTAHSLEPRRPWKAEQLGGGYRLSSLGRADRVRGGRRRDRGQRRACAPTSSTATPTSTRRRCTWSRNGDRHRVLPPDRRHRRRPSGSASTRTAPYALFVGRITRQKGVSHLLAAAHAASTRDVQLVLLRRRAGHPGDRAQRSRDAVADAAGRPRRAWSGSSEMLPRAELVAAAHRTRRCSSARRSTSRSASSTSRRWPARPPSSPATSAASPRSSSTARPACWCTTTPADAGRVRGRPRRADQRRWSPTRPRAAAMGRGRPGARASRVRLGGDRRADRRRLPVRSRRPLTPRSVRRRGPPGYRREARCAAARPGWTPRSWHPSRPPPGSGRTSLPTCPG